MRREGELGGNQVQHILLGLRVGQVGIQEMVTHGGGRILQVLHAERANGLHDVGAHATQWRFQVFTKWRLHLRYSFFRKSTNFWLSAGLRNAACGWGIQGGALTAASVSLACVQRNGCHSTISRKLA